MASFVSCRAHLQSSMRPLFRRNIRMLTTVQEAASPSNPSPALSTSDGIPNTHFKITLRRSAISLGDKIKGTLVSLGIHRRFQTVYHRHTPEVAGKILKLKELLEVENIPGHFVKTKQEQRQERKAPRGYKVVGSKQESFMNI